MIVIIAKQFSLSLDQLIIGGNDMEEKLIKDGSETRKASINLKMIVMGTFLLFLGACCFILKAITVEYIDSSGILHENFFFLPIGYLFLFAGIITFLIVGFKNIVLRFKKNNEQLRVKNIQK